LSGVLVLEEVRAVVADVQPAVEPDRVSTQDVAAQMPANVRAFVDFSLGDVGHLFNGVGRDLVYCATSKKIIVLVLDKMALGWRESITARITATLSFDELFGTFFQREHIFSIALAWNRRMSL
jgi:hypothetical protein